MAIDLNADVGQLFRQFVREKIARKSGEKQEEPAPARKRSSGGHSRSYLPLVFLTLGVIVSMVTYGMIYAFPMQKKNRLLEKQLTLLHEKQAQLPVLQAEIQQYKKNLEDQTHENELLLAEFDDTADLEDLYHAISLLAADNMLTIVNIKKGDTTKHTEFAAVDQTEVTVEISGRFEDYHAFENQLVRQRPLLHVDQESMVSESANTSVAATGRGLQFMLKVKTFTIDKTPYQAFVQASVYGPKPLQEMSDAE